MSHLARSFFAAPSHSITIHKPDDFPLKCTTLGILSYSSLLKVHSTYLFTDKKKIQTQVAHCNKSERPRICYFDVIHTIVRLQQLNTTFSLYINRITMSVLYVIVHLFTHLLLTQSQWKLYIYVPSRLIAMIVAYV